MAQEIIRGPDDQDVSIERFRSQGKIAISSGKNSIVVSEWQARRILGMLSVVLELPLTKDAARQIKLQ